MRVELWLRATVSERLQHEYCRGSKKEILTNSETSTMSELLLTIRLQIVAVEDVGETYLPPGSEA
jgi:hypothetical protein